MENENQKMEIIQPDLFRLKGESSVFDIKGEVYIEAKEILLWDEESPWEDEESPTNHMYNKDGNVEILIDSRELLADEKSILEDLRLIIAHKESTYEEEPLVEIPVIEKPKTKEIDESIIFEGPFEDVIETYEGIAKPFNDIYLDYRAGGFDKVETLGPIKADENGKFVINQSFIPYTHFEKIRVVDSLTGEETIKIIDDYVKDTVPPTGMGIDITVGHMTNFGYTASDMVYGVRDNAQDSIKPKVNITLVSTPSIIGPGDKKAEVRLSDEAGNSTIITIPVKVITRYEISYTQHYYHAVTPIISKEELREVTNIDRFYRIRTNLDIRNRRTGAIVTDSATMVSDGGLTPNSGAGKYQGRFKVGSTTFNVSIEVKGDSFYLKKLPQNINFPTTKIGENKDLLYAIEPLNIEVVDERPIGSKFSVHVSSNGNLRRDGYPELADSLIFIHKDGTKETVVPNIQYKIYENTKNSNANEIPVSWGAKEGFALDIDYNQVYANVPYSTKLTWELRNAP